MKIGIYVNNYLPTSGGAFTFENSILESLSRQKCNHEFFIFYRDTRPFFEKDFFHFISLSEVGYSHINEAIHEHKIAMVWFLTPMFQPVDVPYIYTVLDLQHRLQPYFPEVSVTGWTWDERESLYSSAIRKAALVIVPNEIGRQEVERFYQIPYERIVPLPHPTPEFALKVINEKSTRPDKFFPGDYLFYPAQFWPHKNHVGLLLALKIIRERFELDFSLVLSGSDQGNRKYVEAKTAELNLKPHVHFRGFVSQEELINLYQNAFALIYPSFFGTENLPPLEAFALGCPVIASNVPGAKEQMGDAAILFDPKNEEELALAIKRLYRNIELREELIAKGKRRALRWTSEDYVKGVMKIVDEFEPIRRCWSSQEIYIQNQESMKDSKSASYFSKEFLRYLQKNDNKTFVIFGAGSCGQKVLDYLDERNKKDKANFNVLCVVDNDSSKHGKRLVLNYTIEKPCLEVMCKADRVIIASSPGKSAIYQQLISLGLSKDKILLAI
jgi:glycosyltransferase involved in cell wall biosynthesis